MKKLILWLCCFYMTLAIGYYDNADIVILIDGQRLICTTPPIMESAKVLVPAAAIAKAISYNYSANNITQQIIFSSDSEIITLSPRKALMEINQHIYSLSQNMIWVHHQWYIPIHDFFWYAGYMVHRKGNVYVVSRRIKRVEVEKQSLKLMFANSIPPSFFERIDYQNRIEISIHHSVFMEPRQIKSLMNSPIIKYAIAQTSSYPDTVKLLIYTLAPNLIDVVIDGPILTIRPASKIKPVEQKKLEQNLPEPITATVEPETATPAPETIQEIENTIVDSTGHYPTVSNKSVWLPAFQGIHDVQLNINGHTIQEKGLAIIQDGLYFLPIDTILMNLGYDYHLDDNQKLFVKFGDEDDQLIDVPIRMEGNHAYTAIQTLAQKLGFGLRWDYRIHTLFINTVIHEVTYEKDNGKSQISIKAYGEINAKQVVEMNHPERLVIDIPNTVLDVPSSSFSTRDGLFKKVRIAQLDEHTVRMVVDLHKKMSYGLAVGKDGKEANLVFARWVNRVQAYNLGTVFRLDIEATGVTKYEAKKVDNTILIDFFDAVYKAPEKIDLPDQDMILNVSGLQYSWDPLISRIAIEPKKRFYYQTFWDKKHHRVSIQFSADPKAVMQLQVISQQKAIHKPQPRILALAGKLIVIEAGHGGIDPGAIAANGVYEKVYTLDTAKRLKRLLLEEGATVLMVREDDRYMSLNSRVRFANRQNANLFISIHYNSFKNDSLSGTETYYYKSQDLKFSKIIHAFMVNYLKHNDLGLKKKALYVLHHTDMPAVLVEPLYLSNNDDGRLVDSELTREHVAKSIAEGVKNYYGTK